MDTSVHFNGQRKYDHKEKSFQENFFTCFMFWPQWWNDLASHYSTSHVNVTPKTNPISDFHMSGQWINVNELKGLKCENTLHCQLTVKPSPNCKKHSQTTNRARETLQKSSCFAPSWLKCCRQDCGAKSGCSTSCRELKSRAISDVVCDSAGFEGAQEISTKRDRWSDTAVSTAVDSGTRSLASSRQCSSVWRDEKRPLVCCCRLLLKDCYLHKWRSGKINRLAKSAVQLKGASTSSHSIN